MSEQRQTPADEPPSEGYVPEGEPPPTGLIACCGAAAFVVTFVGVCILVKLFRWAFF